MAGQQLYGIYVTTHGKEWSYPLAVEYSEKKCVDEFCKWLEGLPADRQYKDLSIRVVPVKISPL